MRLLLAARPELLTPVLQVVHRVIGGYLRERSGAPRAGWCGDANPAFWLGGELNIHLHRLVLDGVYQCDGEG
ncbi:MAG: hypothetical protein R3E83_13405 [Burkholderiaceae bacterium]